MLRCAGPVLSVVCISIFTLAAGGDEPLLPTQPQPTEREARVLAALDEPTAVDFAEQPLTDVIDFLKQKHEIEIQLDNKALADAGVGSDTPITRSLHGMSLRSLLRLTLGELDLTYVVGNGYLLITSKTEAENLLRVRVYPVGDLVTTDSEFRPPLGPGATPGSDFQPLIELIASCVAPTTWNEVGGPGSITGHRSSQALTVAQTEEVHEEVAELLAVLRSVRDRQLAAAKPVDPFAKAKPPEDEHKGPFVLRAHRLLVAPAKVVAAPKASAPANDPKAADGKQEEQPGTKPQADAADGVDHKLEDWARAIANVVPEMIEPESWQPAGMGRIRAVGNTLVVWHNDEVQYRVARLIDEILPGNGAQRGPQYYPAVRLSMPAIRVNWPQAEEPAPGAAEARIRAALEEPCELDFAEQPLTDVIDKLQQQHEIQIQLDRKALTDAGVGSDAPITRTLKEINLRTGLKLLLDELDLTFVIRNEVLLITSKTEAESMLTTKVYPVFDLVVRSPDASPQVPGLDFPSLIENITNNLGRTTRDKVGGPGAIKAFANSGALVVSQTSEIHDELAAYLRALREAGRQKQDVVVHAADK
jgi:hypothetical protein